MHPTVGIIITTSCVVTGVQTPPRVPYHSVETVSTISSMIIPVSILHPHHHLSTVQLEGHLHLALVLDTVSEPLETHNQDMTRLEDGHRFIGGFVLATPRTVHGVVSIHQFGCCELFKAVLQSNLTSAVRNGQIDSVELLEEDVELVAVSALVDCFVATID